MKKVFNILIAILLTLATISCNQSEIKIEDIPGIYVCNHKYAPDTLFVLPDSSYVHKVHFKDQFITDNSSWKYEDGKIYFQEFNFYIPEYKSPVEMIGTWVSRVEYSGNSKIRFILSSEQNEFYEKISPAY